MSYDPNLVFVDVNEHNNYFTVSLSNAHVSAKAKATDVNAAFSRATQLFNIALQNHKALTEGPAPEPETAE